MRGLKGLYAQIAALIGGALIGFIVSMMIIQMAQIKTTQELYLSDISSLNTLYMARNMQEYLNISEDELIKEFIESGGPNVCGTITLNNKTTSKWKTDSCEIQYSPELVLNSSGILAEKEVEKYKSFWSVSVSSMKDSFCLEVNDELGFGEYHSKVCFDSPLTDAIDAALGNMTQAYESGSATCSCQETFSICWVEVEYHNFTYALVENC